MCVHDLAMTHVIEAVFCIPVESIPRPMRSESASTALHSPGVAKSSINFAVVNQGMLPMLDGRNTL